MSATLVFEPRVPKRYIELSYELKSALYKRYELNDGITMSITDIPYLKGLKDAGIKDAELVIEAIEKYNEVDLWLEY